MAIEAGGMEGKAGDVDDVAFAGDYDSLAFDGIADLAGHDEPELRAFGMVVALVVGVQAAVGSFRSHR